MRITTFQQLEEICLKRNKNIYEVMMTSETHSGENTEYHTRLQATRSLFAMNNAINVGLKSTETSISGMSGDNCAKWILKIAQSKDLTINLHHIMDFGDGKFEAKILNTGNMIHNMSEFIEVAGKYV